jgi:hypothetical protein
LNLLANSDNLAPPLETPVALIIFNRPDSTSRVFSAIAKAKPKKLLIISDGPRQSRAGEEKLVEECRRIALSVDWECEVLTNFSDINLGCRDRVSTGLDWVFSQVEEAIILEDDCLPSESFFAFASQMLEKYRKDENVGSISGSNMPGYEYPIETSYLFSKFPMIWGWATWARVWNKYQVEVPSWPQVKKAGLLSTTLRTSKGRNFWIRALDGVHKKKIDTWDYQLSLTHWINGYLSVIPSINMISNIGFGAEATHTVNPNSVYSNNPRSEMIFPLTHPSAVKADSVHDLAIEEAKFQTGALSGFALSVFGVLPPKFQKWIVATITRALKR